MNTPIKVHLPFSGSTTYGFGTIVEPGDTTRRYAFECEKGKILFDSFSDRQIKGIEFVFNPDDYNNNLIDYAIEQLKPFLEWDDELAAGVQNQINNLKSRIV